MTVPEGVEIIESVNSVSWIDNYGVLNVVMKGIYQPVDAAAQKESAKAFLEKLKGKKLAVIMDLSNVKNVDASKESRQASAKVMNQLCKAMALIAPTPYSKMVVNVQFNLQRPDFPFEIFETESEARLWLQKFK